MSEFEISRGRPTIDKDPDAYLDYTLDLTDWLSNISDTVVGVVTEEEGVTVEETEILSNGKKIVAWVSGGTPNETGSVTFRFTTAGGRIDDRTLYFNIKER